MSRVAWVYLGTALSLTVWYATSPEAGAAVPIHTSAATLVAVIVGPRVLRTPHRRTWDLMALAVVCWLAGASLRGQQVGGAPLLSDLLTLPGYLLAVATYLNLLRSRGVVRHTGALLDGLVLGTSSSLIVWRLMVQPLLHGVTVDLRQLIFNFIYPVIDIALLLILAQLSFTDVSRTKAYWLFAASISGLLVGDLFWNSAAAGGQVSAVAVTAPYLVGYGALGASMLHPSMRKLTSAQPTRDALPLPRVLTLAIALAGPTALAVLWPGTSFLDRVLVGSAGLGLSLLVLMRTARATNAYAEQADLFEYSATHDELTDLPNRRLLMEYLEEVIEADPMQDEAVVVFFLDLDGFKLINDSWGHEVGDELLVHVAERLRSAVGSDGIVARIGGDEFIVMMRSHGQDRGSLEPKMKEMGQRLLDAFDASFQISSGDVFISPSIGISWQTIGSGGVSAAPTDILHAPDGEPAQERSSEDDTAVRFAVDLLRDADTAMYEAKANGRRRFAMFDVSLRQRVRNKLDLENALRRALETEELSLAYQPLFDIDTRRLVGWEALARWNRPDRGPVSPADFIPVAENTGLIIPLGEWALREALVQLAAWRQLLGSMGPRPEVADLYMSVNVAARQLRNLNLPAVISDALSDNELPASALCVEVTESAVLEDTSDCGATIEKIRSQGVALAVDDFGTGYSALGYLKKYPFSTVKIDRSFVASLETSRDDAVIVKAILAMAEALDLGVVAEGIETEEQAAILHELGCLTGQGYLFGRPETPDVATRRLLAESQKWAALKHYVQ
jgi:diguanylate cyclase (GGDEF)-like protein